MEAKSVEHPRTTAMQAAQNAIRNRNFYVKSSVLSCIITAASVIGYVSFLIISNAELNQFEDNYNIFMDEQIPNTLEGTSCCKIFILCELMYYLNTVSEFQNIKCCKFSNFLFSLFCRVHKVLERAGVRWNCFG